MKKLIDVFLENRSTKKVFLFRVPCANCGEEFGNKPIRFSKADIPVTQNKKVLYDTLYEREMEEARLIALRTAAEHLNYCPICKRLVCNQCFLICEDIDMCRHCAAELEEQGKPVLPGMVHITI